MVYLNEEKKVIQKNDNLDKAKKQKGVMTIEFAIGFIAFWLMCVVWIETSYISYVSSLGDLMISQAARESKLNSDDDNFLGRYEAAIRQDGSIWQGLVNKEKFRYSIRYVKSYEDLGNVTEICQSDDDNQKSLECDKPSGSEKAPIAIYRISYQYEPIFSYFSTSKDVFSREMIVIQEYQREKFILGR